jgi:hypothetical protein
LAILSAIAIACLPGIATAGSPAGLYAPNPPVPTGGHGFAPVVVGDFNGDGNLDVAAANSQDNTVSVLLGDGTGGLVPAPGTPFATGGSNPTALVAGDFDGDGKLDLVVADANSGDVSVLLGNGNGSFHAAGAPVPISICNPLGFGDFLSLTVGDLNGDGHLDVAVADFYCNDVKVLLGDGHGGLALAPGSPFSTGGSYPTSIGVGDFNRDTRADLAVVNSCPPSGSCDNGSVALFLGNGGGTFTPTAGSPFAVNVTEPQALAVGDVNGDGRPDVVVGDTPTAPGGLAVLLGDGQGGLTLAPGSPMKDNSGPITLGDFAGNGRQDVAVPDQFGNTVQVFLSDTSGALTPAPGSPYVINGDPGYPQVEALAVAAGDFNGDGKPDVAVSTTSTFVDKTAFLSLMLDQLAPPAITNSPAAAFFVGQPGSTTITATGFPAPKLGETGTLPSGVTFLDNGNGTATLAGTPGAGTAGTYPLTITASNGVGSASQAFRLIVVNCHGSLSGCNFKKADLSGTNLSGDDLSGANLSGANLANANLSGANLSGANLKGVDFTGANLVNTLFTNANLKGSNMTAADLDGADLSGANTNGITWSAATICPNGTPSTNHVGSTC